ncbi:peptidoglycan DD-metalloendopeptidase family protein [Vibrio algivorus]|uniref:Peptidase M23 n=1 Tax=Vibrio algivorus TaxID=1667024 RepID=A0ABQ6ESB6_9VIBR|nr:peptidoglycan DD-metalloendopeptidase family protein [Vibrio algivorus]GLT16038.1 peptidase M23 [Vibrio algivorus]
MRAFISQLPIFHKVLIGFISALTILVAFSLPDMEELTQHEPRLKVGKHYPLVIPEDIFIQQSPPKVFTDWETYTVKSGESTALLFNRIGLSAQLLYQLVSSNEEIENQLSRLRPGDKLIFGFNENHEFTQLIRPISAYQSFRISKTKDGFRSHIEKKEINKHFNHAEATITSNFWNAAVTSGLTPNQIMSLAGIFGWDIDFALDIRSGDNFKVLFEEQFVEGKNIGGGNILAAVFTNQGTTFKAVLNPEDGNYYAPDGRAMKKAFLRSPIDFRRVTSNFNPTRRHPVTGKVVAHRGTDYAAPVGTAIWAAGDGIVEKAGYNQFNGNYVFLRHSNTYITKYLHMKKRLVKTGQRVKQGDTIGTLGGTGRVTGPHLHYEFLVNGIHKNPRTVDLPQSRSLTGDKKTRFVKLAKQQLDKLNQYDHRLIAQDK